MGLVLVARIGFDRDALAADLDLHQAHLRAVRVGGGGALGDGLGDQVGHAEIKDADGGGIGEEDILAVAELDIGSLALRRVVADGDHRGGIVRKGDGDDGARLVKAELAAAVVLTRDLREAERGSGVRNLVGNARLGFIFLKADERICRRVTLGGGCGNIKAARVVFHMNGLDIGGHILEQRAAAVVLDVAERVPADDRLMHALFVGAQLQLDALVHGCGVRIGAAALGQENQGEHDADENDRSDNDDN